MGIKSIAILCAIAIFFIIILVFVLKDIYNRKNSPKENQEEWLFSNWSHKVYSIFFDDKDPIAVCKKMGVNPQNYIDSCKILKIEPDVKDLVTKKFVGIAAFILFSFIGLLLEETLFLVIGAVIALIFVLFTGKDKEVEAKNRRLKLSQELPRFLDLLETALYINLPISSAIEVTVKHLDDTVIAEEFNEAMMFAKLGAGNWQTALLNIADRYSIDEFSDFVMDLIISYEKGLSIYESVRKKNDDIKQTELMRAKEKATKLNTMVLIPIVIFKIIPLLAVMLIPIIVQLNEAF